MKYAIRHEFVYRYDSPVRLSTQYLRLTPRETARQQVFDWKLDTPGPALRTTDGYGNVLHVLTIDTPVSEIAILASGRVETSPRPDELPDFGGAPLPPLVFLRPTPLTRADASLAALAARFRGHGSSAAALHELAAALPANGSAADAVHAFIACCRVLGIPARYVSGYVYDEQVAMHAWAEAWLDDCWRSFDISRKRAIDESHIKIAVGADYLDACPVRGVRVGGGAETLTAEAHVEASQQ